MMSESRLSDRRDGPALRDNSLENLGAEAQIGPLKLDSLLEFVRIQKPAG